MMSRIIFSQSLPNIGKHIIQVFLNLLDPIPEFLRLFRSHDRCRNTKRCRYSLQVFSVT